MYRIILFVKRGIFKTIQFLFKSWYGSYPITILENKHISNCKILLDRSDFLAHLPKYGNIAEIGVEHGIFSEQILSICEPQKLELVDWWLDKSMMNSTKERLSSFDNISFIRATSIDYLSSKEKNSLDWVYIDTDHTYKTTKKELELARIITKSAGLICGHDYTSVDYGGIKKYGVVEAVNEFCKKYDYQFIYLTHETSRHLSYAIQKI